MKTKDGFVLREIAGTWVVLSLANSTASFNGMMTLNESGAFLWKLLEKGASCAELISALTEEYEVTTEIASADVNKFLAKLGAANCIDMQ